MKITCTQAVEALRQFGEDGATAKRLAAAMSATAAVKAGKEEPVTPRAIATALRKAVEDKRVRITSWKNVATYRHVAKKCLVKGMPRAGAMCGKVLVGGSGCAFGGHCPHKVTA